MPETPWPVDPDGRERSRTRPRDSIRFGTGTLGVERAEVYFSAGGFEPHRHDSYAIGITTAGVQRFDYRGSRRVCLPGQLHILHPDETHDGVAGTDDGFGYRMLYVAPALVRDALDGGALPFVADPVQDPTPTTSRVGSLLADIDDPISDLARSDIAATIADTLRSLGGGHGDRDTTIDMRAVGLVRDYLATHAAEQTTAATLEQIAGADRFTIARHFRRAFGTSPDRYRTLRRLALVRAAIERGKPLAQAAVEFGFADQSHMTRQFKRAYGLTPAAWRDFTSVVSSSGSAGEVVHPAAEPTRVSNSRWRA